MTPAQTDAPTDPDRRERLIDGRVAAITTRFPDRFSPEQVAEIRNRVARSFDLGTKLADVHLPNGVGPNFDPRAIEHV